MRIPPINNQIPNNKPAFGMAVNRINTSGMTNLEKQAVLECLPALKTLFKDINGEIMLDNSGNTLGRQFKVFASDPLDSGKKVYESISNGVHFHSGDKVGLKWLKLELFKNAEDTVKTYLAKNKAFGKSGELDNAIAQELNKSKERVADNVRSLTGLTAKVS